MYKTACFVHPADVMHVDRNKRTPTPLDQTRFCQRTVAIVDIIPASHLDWRLRP